MKFPCHQVTELIDYEQFCGSSATDKDGEVALLPFDQRITARKLAEVVFTQSFPVFNQRRSPIFQVIKNETPHLLVDVRPEVEMELCSIPNSINLPLARLKEGKDEDVDRLRREGEGKPIYIICR